MTRLFIKSTRPQSAERTASLHLPESRHRFTFLSIIGEALIELVRLTIVFGGRLFGMLGFLSGFHFALVFVRVFPDLRMVTFRLTECDMLCASHH